VTSLAPRARENRLSAVLAALHPCDLGAQVFSHGANAFGLRLNDLQLAAHSWKFASARAIHALPIEPRFTPSLDYGPFDLCPQPQALLLIRPLLLNLILRDLLLLPLSLNLLTLLHCLLPICTALRNRCI